MKLLSQNGVLECTFVKELFSSVEELSLLHNEFADRVEDRNTSWSDEQLIGDVLVDMVSDSVYLSVYLSIYLSVYLSVSLFVYLSIHPSIHPYIHTSIHPYIHPYIHPSIHPFIITVLQLSSTECI